MPWKNATGKIFKATDLPSSLPEADRGKEEAEGGDSTDSGIEGDSATEVALVAVAGGTVAATAEIATAAAGDLEAETADGAEGLLPG